MNENYGLSGSGNDVANLTPAESKNWSVVLEVWAVWAVWAAQPSGATQSSANTKRRSAAELWQIKWTRMGILVSLPRL